MQYSLKKGFGKGLAGVFTMLIAFVTFAGLSDISIWDLFVEYVKPLVGSLTLGGALVMALNWLKVKSKE